MSARVARVGVVLVTAFALSGATGCGKGSYRAPQAGSAAALRRVHEPPLRRVRRVYAGPLTARQARAFARTVNLTQADVVGASATAKGREPGGSEVDARRCGGALADRRAVQLASPNFVRGKGLTREALSSRVTVLSRASDARAAIAIVDTPAWRSCYSDVLRRHFSGSSKAAGAGAPGVRVGGVEVSRIAVRLAAADATFGLRIAARVSSARSRLTITLYLDVFGFALGRSEVNMDATSYVQPEPARTEQELLRLMYDRASLARS
jgi:hypothetical protein